MKRQLAASVAGGKRNKAAAFATFRAGCVVRYGQFTQGLPYLATMRAAQCDVYAWNQSAGGEASRVLSRFWTVGRQHWAAGTCWLLRNVRASG
ncbi:MAG TPA: hypothetical protein VFF39_00925 [Verrucomicrobiae bacterium]|nr:hypothetical protein [Verrucomicrobiae bacterium]